MGGGAVIAAAAMAAARHLVQRLREAGALSPATATGLVPRRGFERRQLERLERRGVIRRVPGDRFYLDEAAYSLWEEERRRRAWLVLGIALAGLLGLAWVLWRQHG